MMTRYTELEEVYFDWLRSECFTETSERREYEGVLKVLHDIPFFWVLMLDQNRAGDALSYRQNDFLGFQGDLDAFDQHWLHNWAESTPSVLEVMLGMARRWSFYFEESIAFYFAHMFVSMQFDRYPGRHLVPASDFEVRHKCNEWLSRQFQPNGEGSPFPIKHALDIVDFRQVDMWAQMNAYSAEHFQ